MKESLLKEYGKYWGEKMILEASPHICNSHIITSFSFCFS